MADVVLKDKSGNPVTYAGVTAVQLRTPDGGMQLFPESGGGGGESGGGGMNIATHSNGASELARFCGGLTSIPALMIGAAFESAV